MKEYYRNYDPEEVDSRGKKQICKRRILHIVSTALSFETMKNAILFTFDDHPIIPELIRNLNTTLDDILEENGISLGDERKMKKLRELQDLLKQNQEDEIDDLMRWVSFYCNEFVSELIFILIIFTLSFLLIVIYW